MDSSNIRFLRTLDSFEECFWHLEQGKTTAPVVAYELSGRVTLRDVQAACSIVQGRYPLLKGCISKSDGERPAFYVMHGGRLTAREAEARSDSRVLDQMLLEMEQGFKRDGDNLARTVLVQFGAHSVLLLAAHHAAFDGRTMMMVLEDLLRVMAGECLPPPFASAPSISEIACLIDQAPYLSASEADEAPVAPAEKHTAVLLEKAPFDEAHTRAVLGACKTNGSSVTGMLAAALAQAGQELESGWRGRELLCAAPVDLRSIFGAGDAPGLLVGPQTCMISAVTDATFWQTARSNTTTFRAMLGRDRQRDLAMTMRNMVDRERSPENFLRQWSARGRSPDIMVNSYAKFPTRTAFGAMSLRSAWSASHAGATQKVSAVTVAGRMTLALATSQKIAGLLMRAVEIISAQAK